MESKNIENPENKEIEENQEVENQLEIVENPADNENEETEENKEEKIFSFEYDVKNEEEDVAFTAFQKKFVFKRNIIQTILFGILGATFVFSAVKNGGYLPTVLSFICFTMIFITWYNTFRIKKYLLSALKTLESDRYIFSIYETFFRIETVITEEEKNSEDFVPIKPKDVKFGEKEIYVIEKKDMFIIIVRKETNYVLPKRCLDEKGVEIIRNCLSKAFKDTFESEV